MDDAIELLFSMPSTCSLDVAADNSEGLLLEQIGALLGVTRQAAEKEVARAHRRWLVQLRHRGIVEP